MLGLCLDLTTEFRKKIGPFKFERYGEYEVDISSQHISIVGLPSVFCIETFFRFIPFPLYRNVLIQTYHLVPHAILLKKFSNISHSTFYCYI